MNDNIMYANEIHSPVTPDPSKNTSALHKRTGGGREDMERAILKPMCWKKCLRNQNLKNLEAVLPLVAQEPPCRS